ncbi:MAG TPA: PQQ-dependent sugar dehydrogenase, partial [Gaiellaceae bacterium]|nr:PQQ-dependent sugar dehydrogenase [Gaiellaceae bacterium]
LTNADGIASAPGDASTLYVVEQQGTVEMVRDGQKAGVFLDLTDRVGYEQGGERGLLGLAFSPAYATNHLFYVDYTDTAGTIHVVEMQSVDGAGDPSTARELLDVPHPWPNHNGGQLQFDSTGHLWVTIGDGGTDPNGGGTSIGDPMNHAQKPSSRLAKLLRIDPSQPNAAWQVVGIGLRNAWRFSFDRKTGNLWIADVGAATEEEVDFRPAAKAAQRANFGWSRFEGTELYNGKVKLRKGWPLVKPVWAYSHSGSRSCSIIGGYVYRGSAVPSLYGRYVFGDFCSGWIWTLTLKKGKAKVVQRNDVLPTLSSFGEDAAGELYAVTLTGELYELR